MLTEPKNQGPFLPGGNGKLDTSSLLAAFEQAMQSVPAADLPALLGELEKIKVIGWARTMHGPENGQADDVLTVPEVAARLKLSRYRTYELCRQGTLKSIRLGNAVRVKPSALAEYLAQQGA